MGQTARDALHALQRIVRAAELSAADLSTRTQLTPSQAVVLQIIVREGQIDAGTVSSEARLSQAATTPILMRLDEQGLIVREREPSDRRRARLRATESGQDMVQELANAKQSEFLKRFSALDSWMQKGLVVALECLANLLEPAPFPARRQDLNDRNRKPGPRTHDAKAHSRNQEPDP